MCKYLKEKRREEKKKSAILLFIFSSIRLLLSLTNNNINMLSKKKKKIVCIQSIICHKINKIKISDFYSYFKIILVSCFPALMKKKWGDLNEKAGIRRQNWRR